jgi:glyoxylate/hydroxypyruvate reductase A
MLPLTPDTSNIMDRTNMSKLPLAPTSSTWRAARTSPSRIAHADQVRPYRRRHAGRVPQRAAAAQHPFWQEPRITITPHISALTLRRERAADCRQHAQDRSRRTSRRRGRPHKGY